jgi:hypothetical protein
MFLASPWSWGPRSWKASCEVVPVRQQVVRVRDLDEVEREAIQVVRRGVPQGPGWFASVIARASDVVRRRRSAEVRRSLGRI